MLRDHCKLGERESEGEGERERGRGREGERGESGGERSVMRFSVYM